MSISWTAQDSRVEKRWYLLHKYIYHTVEGQFWVMLCRAKINKLRACQMSWPGWVYWWIVLCLIENPGDLLFSFLSRLCDITKQFSQFAFLFFFFGSQINIDLPIDGNILDVSVCLPAMPVDSWHLRGGRSQGDPGAHSCLAQQIKVNTAQAISHPALLHSKPFQPAGNDKQVPIPFPMAWQHCDDNCHHLNKIDRLAVGLFGVRLRGLWDCYPSRLVVHAPALWFA